ncbi:hypothetical protein TNCV_3623211 [Trichonephila clavipes]|nr:hypothetical protein TNCV_3623211 [Trichonephila clavipes]
MYTSPTAYANPNANQRTKIIAFYTNFIIPTLPNIMMSKTCHARRQAIDRLVEVSRPNNKISSGGVDSLNGIGLSVFICSIRSIVRW